MTVNGLNKNPKPANILNPEIQDLKPYGALASLYHTAIETHEPGEDDRVILLIDKLIEASILLRKTKAVSLQELAEKIAVWRAITDEDNLSYNTASPDGCLLLSIIEDIERLAE